MAKAKIITTDSAVERRADTAGRVKPKDTVKVVWTGTDKIHNPGQVSEIHPVQFGKMSARGFAEEWTAEREEELKSAEVTDETSKQKPKVAAKDKPEPPVMEL